jgi:hypothetical protein
MCVMTDRLPTRPPPAALFHYSRDRKGEHPERHLVGFTGWLQADAFAGYNRLCEPDRRPRPIGGVLCWAHARRGFFKLADIAANTRRGKDAPPISPLALEAVRRIDVLFDLERALNGKPAAERLAVRQEHGTAQVTALEGWMRTERARLSRHAPVAKAMDYMLTRWEGFTRFLDDGRLCLTNNTAERGLRGIALGRKAWLFCGSDRGGRRSCTACSPPRNSTTSIPRRGSPTCWRASTTCPKPACASSCPGSGGNPRADESCLTPTLSGCLRSEQVSASTLATVAVGSGARSGLRVLSRSSTSTPCSA